MSVMSISINWIEKSSTKNLCLRRRERAAQRHRRVEPKGRRDLERESEGAVVGTQQLRRERTSGVQKLWGKSESFFGFLLSFLKLDSHGCVTVKDRDSSLFKQAWWQEK